MIDRRLASFLNEAYAQRVLGKPTYAADIFNRYRHDPVFIKAARDEVARIKAICHIDDLPKRDFAAFQHLRSLEHALDTQQ